MRTLFALMFLSLLWEGVSAQVQWVREARFEAGLQLPAYAGNPSVLAYRTPILWPLGASAAAPVEPIFVGTEPEYQYSIPRHYFRSEEAFRRYYLDNPSRRKSRIAAPPLSDVPTLHRPRNTYDFSFTF
jgi:hypothetical protein